MRFPFTLGVLLVAGVAFAAPIPKSKEVAKDEAAIQGTWVVEKFDGQGAPPPEVGAIRFTFKDGKLAVELGGRTTSKEGNYKLDPKAKLKTIDLTNDNGQVAPGIYQLEGDTLKICLAEGPNAARPTEFKADDKRVAMVTFKRVKAEKKVK